MKLTLSLIAIFLIIPYQANAQKKRVATAARTRSIVSTRSSEIGKTGVILDETLSVLREKPSLFAEPIQRMHRGRKVMIQGVAESDGVRFYKVAAPPSNFGWVQAEAVYGKFRASDEERLARLVQASDGFDQIELAVSFLDLYPESKLRPAILLLFGDLVEEVAVKLSRDAKSRLSNREMAASAAPVHSYFLNFVSLDRYRKLGILFLFNPATRTFHYDGWSWKQLVTKFPAAAEGAEAQKRLDALKLKMSEAGRP
jgi:hypothetical protein